MLYVKTVRIDVDSPADICAFIEQHGDRHITLDALAYYKDPDGPGIGILGYEGTQLVGISACKIDDNKMSYAVSVTHRDYRKRGIGSALLRQKIADAGVPYSTIVASDNPASIRMCEKAGLQNVGALTRNRAAGSYVALEFRENEQRK
jgi:GNAT superfamily N-acetyltransferase